MYIFTCVRVFFIWRNVQFVLELGVQKNTLILFAGLDITNGLVDRIRFLNRVKNLKV